MPTPYPRNAVNFQKCSTWPSGQCIFSGSTDYSPVGILFGSGYCYTYLSTNTGTQRFLHDFFLDCSRLDLNLLQLGYHCCLNSIFFIFYCRHSIINGVLGVLGPSFVRDDVWLHHRCLCGTHFSGASRSSWSRKTHQRFRSSTFIPRDSFTDRTAPCR